MTEDVKVVLDGLAHQEHKVNSYSGSGLALQQAFKL